MRFNTFIITLTFLGISMAPSSFAFRDSKNDRVPVQYRLRQILLEPTPSPELENKVLKRVYECLKKTKSGEDFSSLARKYSQEPGVQKSGGDLGFFSFKQMVKPFSEAVFSMKPGEIRGPVKTQFGFHIIKLLEIRSQKRHAQHILFAIIPDHDDSLAVLDALTKIHDQIVDGTGFDEILEKYNTYDELRETSGYMVWQKPEEMLPEYFQAVRGLKVGDVSNPFVSILGFHVVVVDSINYDASHILQGFPAAIEKKLKEKNTK
ncbi:MAG: peptidylprolyl isomerase [Candidatus Latescibacter sp.]|nr:peptidylprolyl isomerase [Candidatus Latescibacter sp.]